ncbi:hypothetical protein EMIT0P44_130077 [Pseudomonas sp. IT-P44]
MPTAQNLRSASRGGVQIKSGRRANARPDEWWKSKAYGIPCRSRLAGDGGGSVNLFIGWTDAIASKLAPTREMRMCLDKYDQL